MIEAAITVSGVGIVLWLRWRVRRPPSWRYQAKHRRAMRSIR